VNYGHVCTIPDPNYQSIWYLAHIVHSHCLFPLFISIGFAVGFPLPIIAPHRPSLPIIAPSSPIIIAHHRPSTRQALHSIAHHRPSSSPLNKASLALHRPSSPVIAHHRPSTRQGKIR